MSESEDNNSKAEQNPEAESASPEQEQEQENDSAEAQSGAASSGASGSGAESNSDQTAEDSAAESGAEDNSAADSNAAESGDVESDESGNVEADHPEDDAPAEPVHIPELSQIIEGAILAADKPLSIDHIIQLFPDGEPSRAHVREAIEEIQTHCEGRGYQLKQVASGYRFQVHSEYGEWIGRLWDERAPRYTRALLETLALIAYKQPITRGDIEDIRGVAVSTNIIRTLLEREWIRVVGHRDVPGRPSIFATTKTFLDYFDLNSLDELPTLSEIKDLDKLNPELDLEDLIEPRTLSLEPNSEEMEAAGADDETLNEVTDRVNEIQQNIKNLFKEPEPEDDFDEDDDEIATTGETAEGSDHAEGSDIVADEGVADPAESALEDTESNTDPGAESDSDERNSDSPDRSN
jgi:segregation and condensation protein B